MIPFPSGGHSLYQAQRPFHRPAIFVIILISLLLAACGVTGNNDNWPGLSTDGEHVFVAYGAGVLAVDAATGDEIWSFPDDPNSRLKYYAAPSWQDGRLLLGDYGASGGLLSPGIIVSVYALLDDGRGSPELLWQDSELVHDRIVAPMLQVGDQAIVSTANNFVYALDAESGKVNWQFETGHAIWGQPAYKGDTLFVTSLDKSVYALDISSGREKWHTTFAGAIASAPVVNENLVYVANFDNKIHALDIETGNERWTAVAEDWIWGTPAYADGVLYYADAQGNVFAVNARNGEQIWTQAVELPVQSSPVVFGEIIYIAADSSGEEPSGQLLALSRQDGSELWTKDTPAPLYSTPIIVGEQIVVALQSETMLLAAFNLESGNKEWDLAPPG